MVESLPTFFIDLGYPMSIYKITIDQQILDSYNKYYFSLYPRRKKEPIEKPIPMSLNRFITLKRMVQNALKQKYKEFSVWLASYYSIADLNLDKAKMTFTFYFPDHRRRDFDNLMLVPKFINDGLVESHVFKDDNGENLMLEFRPFQYDKNNPRVEIIIVSGENLYA